MRLIGKLRFSIGSLMMFVLMVAAGAALFVKILEHDFPNYPPVSPTGSILAIVLATVALGSWKGHTATQIMLQTTLACLICLSSYWCVESQHERAILYWYEGVFAMTVTLPMVVRRHVKAAWPKGPRRESWKKTCEAVSFSFLAILIGTAGGIFQGIVADGLSYVTYPAAPGSYVPAPLLSDPALLVPPPALAPSLDPKTP